MRFCHNTPGCDPAVGARIARPLASGCKAPRPTKSRSAALHPTQALAGRCGHRPLRPRLRPSRRGGLYGRPAPGIDSRRGPSVPPAVGARIARPLASGCKAPRRPQPPQHAVGRHAHMPPEPGALCSGPRWFRRPGRGGVWAPRPTKNQACSRSATLHPTQELAGRCGHRPLRPRLRPSRRGGLYGRPAPGIDSRRGPSVPPAVGARIARPLASGCKAPRRPQPPQHAVGRHAHMPPEPGALCSGPRWFRRPGRGGVWAPRPTKNQACSRSATLHPTQELAGRCGHRPLRTRPRPHRRGGLYARPAPGTDSRRRGAHCASAGLGLLGRAFFPYVFFDSSGSKYAFISPTN